MTQVAAIATKVAPIPLEVPAVLPQLMPIPAQPVAAQLPTVAPQFPPVSSHLLTVPPNFTSIVPVFPHLFPLPEAMVVARTRRLCRQRCAQQQESSNQQ